jgi:hypothetical protein
VPKKNSNFPGLQPLREFALIAWEIELPQRLKPGFEKWHNGTAEAVPFQKP